MQDKLKRLHRYQVETYSMSNEITQPTSWVCYFLKHLLKIHERVSHTKNQQRMT